MPDLLPSHMFTYNNENVIISLFLAFMGIYDDENVTISGMH